MNDKTIKFQEPFNWQDNWQDEASYGNEWDSDPAYELLGHSSELQELDEQGIGEIVRQIANNSKIADQFKDIRILHSDQDNFIACVDSRTGILYLNANNRILSTSELIRGVNGLMNHESLHINNWLGIPGNAERAQKNAKAVKKFNGDKDTLNWLYDLEGHYQSDKGFLSPIQQLELREFITMTRIKILDLDPKSPILSMEYPKTKMQKEIKKIISNRSKTLLTKAKLIDKLLKDNNYGQPQPGDGPPQDGKGKKGKGNCSGQGTPSKDQKKGSEGSQNDPDEGTGSASTGNEPPEPIVITKVIGNDKEQVKWLKDQLDKNHIESLSEKILEEHEYRELQKKLQRHGISAGNTKDIVNYFKDNTQNAKAEINNLNQCLKDMLGFDSGFLKKLKEPSPRIGYRINGYRKARDIQEMAQSIESLITDGLVDINDVRVPDLINRKRKGLMVIIRDVSGSVLQKPVDQVVRDATMILISQAKKEKHRVAVLDFAIGAYFIPDHQGKNLTENHENLLCKSAFLKGGGGTHLCDAIKELNELIDQEKLHNTPINVFVITDSFIHDDFDYDEEAKACKINHTNLKLTGIVYNRGNCANPDFNKFIELHNGKNFFIELSVDKKLISGLKNISSRSSD